MPYGGRRTKAPPWCVGRYGGTTAYLWVTAGQDPKPAPPGFRELQHGGRRGGRGFPTPVFSRQLGLFLLGYRGVFSIFWKRFNMFFLITKPGGNEGKQAKTQTNPAEMPEDRRRWGPGWLGTSTEGPRGSLQTSFKSRNQPDEGLCMSGTPPAAKKPTGWPFPAWNPAF